MDYESYAKGLTHASSIIKSKRIKLKIPTDWNEYSSLFEIENYINLLSKNIMENKRVLDAPFIPKD